MRKKIIHVILFLLALSISINAAFADLKKTRIAVLDFKLEGEKLQTEDIGKIIAAWLTTALVKEGRFDVIERRLLEKVIEEQKLGASGLIDEKTASKLGRVLGAKIIVTGSVMKYQNVIEVNVRLIDVETGTIMAAENVKSTSTVKIEELIIQVSEKIIKDFPLDGYIAQRNKDENKIIIDLGLRAGVKAGMQFIVYKEGKIIKHPLTGEIIDTERKETGIIEIHDVMEKTSEGIILREVSPNAIEYGQVIKSSKESSKSSDFKTKPFEIIDETSGSFFQSRIKAINLLIEQAEQLKDDGDGLWENKIKEVFIGLKLLAPQYRTAPELYLAYAKAFFIADKKSKAEKSLVKAVYYRPRYADAFEFKGDMCYKIAKNIEDREERAKGGYDKMAVEAYEAAIKASSYNKEFQAEMYFKIGNVYADLTGDRRKAEEYWGKTVSTAPNCEAAILAGQRLKAN